MNTNEKPLFSKGTLSSENAMPTQILPLFPYNNRIRGRGCVLPVLLRAPLRNKGMTGAGHTDYKSARAERLTINN